MFPGPRQRVNQRAIRLNKKPSRGIHFNARRKKALCSLRGKIPRRLWRARAQNHEKAALEAMVLDRIDGHRAGNAGEIPERVHDSALFAHTTFRFPGTRRALGRRPLRA